MTEIAVYDPPMCCSTGVCGPDTDQALVQFAAQLEWAGRNGAKISRFNLGHEPGAFATNALVRSLLESEGMGCLPLVIADNQVVTKGGYPSKETLQAMIASPGTAPSNAALSGTEASSANSASACCGDSKAKTSCCG